MNDVVQAYVVCEGHHTPGTFIAYNGCRQFIASCMLQIAYNLLYATCCLKLIHGQLQATNCLKDQRIY